MNRGLAETYRSDAIREIDDRWIALAPCQQRVSHYDDGIRAQIETRVVPNYRLGSRVEVLGASIEPIVAR